MGTKNNTYALHYVVIVHVLLPAKCLEQWLGRGGNRINLAAVLRRPCVPPHVTQKMLAGTGDFHSLPVVSFGDGERLEQR